MAAEIAVFTPPRVARDTSRLTAAPRKPARTDEPAFDFAAPRILFPLFPASTETPCWVKDMPASATPARADEPAFDFLPRVSAPLVPASTEETPYWFNDMTTSPAPRPMRRWTTNAYIPPHSMYPRMWDGDVSLVVAKLPTKPTQLYIAHVRITQANRVTGSFGVAFVPLALPTWQQMLTADDASIESAYEASVAAAVRAARAAKYVSNVVAVHGAEGGPRQLTLLDGAVATVYFVHKADPRMSDAAIAQSRLTSALHALRDELSRALHPTTGSRVLLGVRVWDVAIDAFRRKYPGYEDELHKRPLVWGAEYGPAAQLL